jgi:hypothetical protein
MERWLREANFEVRTCGGPAERRSPCLAFGAEGCPLWAGADVVVYDSAASTTYDHLQREVERHPGTRLLILTPASGRPQVFGAAEIVALDSGRVAEAPESARALLMGSVSRGDQREKRRPPCFPAVAEGSCRQGQAEAGP